MILPRISIPGFAERLYNQLTPRQFILVAACAVGIWAGGTAVLLKIIVHYLQTALTSYGMVWNIVYILAPAVGIGITQLFIHFILGGNLQRGTAHVLDAMARKSSKLPPEETYAHAVTSAFTVGFGGSAGLEAPIVQTGAAIGSVFSSGFPLSYRERTLLLACGAAAGIAAAFNAPIAGVLIAIEVLLVDAGASAFIPLLLAGATGALISHISLSETVLFSFRQIAPFNYFNLPYYLILGILCGLTAAAYKKTLPAFERVFKARFKSVWARMAGGGLLLGGLIIIFPSLYGEGYPAIRALADQRPEQLFEGSVLKSIVLVSPWVLGLAVLAAGLLKPAAVAITLGAGGNGGNFAPALLTGSVIGFSFAWFVDLSGIAMLPPSNFTLVAMAGVLAGIFHAPLSGIFLIAEITGGYGLMLPLMLVSALSTAVSRYLIPKSLDQSALAERKSDTELNRDLYVLADLDLMSLVERDFTPVYKNHALKSLIEAISHSKRNVFPVVDAQNHLTGMVYLEDIREVMFDATLYNLVTIDEVMVAPAAIILSTDEIPTVMKKFEKTGLWNLPVTENGVYCGFISKSSMFEAYRSRLKES